MWRSIVPLCAGCLLFGCDRCPGGESPRYQRVVACDELTRTCEEVEVRSCPCPPGQPCPRGGSCRATSGLGAFSTQPPLGAAHVVDGRFTGGEWEAATRIEGLMTDVYVDLQDGRLYFLNDWRSNTEGIRPDCFNYFRLTVGDEDIELRVFGSGEVEVTRDGVDVSDNAVGAYGFGPSPMVEEPHTIYEFSLGVSANEIDVCCFDPVTESTCDVLAQEPMVVSIRAARGVEVRRSVPVGTRRLPRGARCGEGQGICEDGLSCARVGDGRECVVPAAAPAPDAGAPRPDGGPPT